MTVLFVRASMVAPSASAAPQRGDLAQAVPIDSTIRSLSVFCQQGAPMIAMWVTVRPPAGSVTLTFVCRGWTVNVPMVQADDDARLWWANLSLSPLPLWLSHESRDPELRQIARLADRACLRIDGGTQGKISLANSSITTRAALGDCYHYY